MKQTKTFKFCTDKPVLMITRVIHTGLTVILNCATKISENNKNERSPWNVAHRLRNSVMEAAHFH